MAFLEKVNSYRYWLKFSARMCLPMKHDFYGLGDALLEIGEVLFRQIVRLLFLVTFPVSVPLIAFLLWKRNKEVIETRN